MRGGFRGVPARLKTRVGVRVVERSCSGTPSQRFFGSSSTHSRFNPEDGRTRGYLTKSHAMKSSSFAFAFDIDGVLMHLSTPIAGAADSLRRLQADHIPFILLTNGGGKHESDRVAELCDRLGVRLAVDSFVQSHTPFRELAGPEGLEGVGAGGFAERTVLVTGSHPGRCREIAEAYGFKNVIIPADILQAQPTVFPFDPVLAHVHGADARPLICAPESLTVDAIFVFNDPRDWALDIQIIVDLLLSHRGRLGTLSPRNGNRTLPGAGWQSDGQPRLYFSNNDTVWSTPHHLPRLGQGSFQAAVEGVWKRVTGGAHLDCVRVGKPSAGTYRLAEKVLETHASTLLGGGGRDAQAGTGTGMETKTVKLSRVYMVGDNPESDVRGANEYRSPRGTEWCSVLVRTGVWSPRTAADQPMYKPMMIADDVRAAVDWALEREGHIAGKE